MDQNRIWDHFQTTRVDAFDQAGGRYAAIVAEVRRQMGRDSGRVLTIGIGAGRIERLLHARGFSVSSLDPSAEPVAALIKLGIDARCGFAQCMPFDAASFDVVIASEVLEHIEPAVRAVVLAEIARVLVAEGCFLGTVPYREVLAESEVVCPDCGKVFHRWGHVSSFDLQTLRCELAGTFGAVSCRRRSFVDWAAARTPMRLTKAVVQSLLGRMGEPIANPGILFAARKPAVR